MACLFVAAITNLGHGRLALEATPDPVIDTLGLPPCLLHTVVTVRLVTLEFGGALFDDLDGHRGELLGLRRTTVTIPRAWNEFGMLM